MALRLLIEKAQEIVEEALKGIYAYRRGLLKNYRDSMAAHKALGWWYRWVLKRPSWPQLVFIEDESRLLHLQKDVRNATAEVVLLTNDDLACIFKHYKEK